MKAINDAFSLYRVGHPGDRSRGRQEVSQVDRMSSPSLRGFICAHHSAAPGSNPKHTINAFFNLKCWNCISVCCWNKKWTKVNKKRPGLAHFLTIVEAFTKKLKMGGRHSSVVSSAPTILRPEFESQAHQLRFFQFVLLEL